MVTRCDLANPEEVSRIRETVLRIKADLPIVESTHRPAQWRNSRQETAALEALQNRPIAAFCGLGNPEAFRQTLVKLGLNVVAWRTFPDHHAYSRDDVEELRSWARQLAPDAAVVTTQKDLVKLRLDRLGERELWALQIQLQITSGQEAFEALLQKTAQAPG
jgi:tetraacyldisaccharide 4'-kinase